MNIAHTIDHTLLRPEQSTPERVVQLCHEAIEYGFASVCVLPCYVPLAVKELAKTAIPVCSVVGFPLGGNLSVTKRAEAEHLLAVGARELDMVLNIAALKSGDTQLVVDDIAHVVDVAHANGAIVKVIVECGALSQEEKIRAAHLVSTAGADFIKTSTGFGYGGATVDDVQLLRQHVASHVKVKASGGIRTRAQAVELLHAGASRLGTSAGVAIVTDAVESSPTPY
ncbi:MAG: 2-deoxyribose-5-phosphate aldolase [Chlorobi bacterium NICIL-2]|jgi:deoxyribose-phosphate aldolase|nr:MAG: 2-deoxyribose-5-phosphate aldolase [Chlorobi bacterium NICIL-2]